MPLICIACSLSQAAHRHRQAGWPKGKQTCICRQAHTHTRSIDTHMHMCTRIHMAGDVSYTLVLFSQSEQDDDGVHREPPSEETLRLRAQYFASCDKLNHSIAELEYIQVEIVKLLLINDDNRDVSSTFTTNLRM